MSVVYGTVIEKQLNVDIRKQDGGFYKGYRVVYRNENGEIKELAKTMQSLKFTPSVAATLNELTQGDEFTLVQEKNQKGFLDVKSFSKGKVEVELPDNEPTSVGGVSPTKAGQEVTASSRGKVIGSTYETPEERALRRKIDIVKQRVIVRQSALNTAAALGAKGHEKAIEVAKELEKYIFEGIEFPE